MPYELAVGGKERLREKLGSLRERERATREAAAQVWKEEHEPRENTAFHEARGWQGQASEEAENLQRILLDSKEVPPPGNGRAGLSSLLTFKFDDQAKPEKLTLVSQVEADPLKSLINIGSELGKQLIGKTPGERVGHNGHAGVLLVVDGFTTGRTVVKKPQSAPILGAR